MKQELRALLERALANITADQDQALTWPPAAQIEHARDTKHGDFACNLAMVLAKPLKQPPRALAQQLIENLPENTLIQNAEVAGPGFINLFVAEQAMQSLVDTILAAGENFGIDRSAQRGKLMVEFVSANPTGPLHVGHGRGAAVGDCLARLYEATGWAVTREFYYNDAGAQIANLAASVQARLLGKTPDDADWPKDGYQGEYIRDVAKAYAAGETVRADDREVTGNKDPDNIDAIREFAVAYLRREQDADLKAFDVGFDVYALESGLYADGKVEQAVQALVEGGHTFEQDQALWLRTTDFGDDKDRVMRKTDGGYTYFVPDVAYHVDKWNRGFRRVINEQGADHHSTITRVRAGLQALDIGIPKGWPDYVLHQMVTVMRGGEEVKLSKRAGAYVTLRDLIDEVGRDATRYFLVARKSDSQLVFDIDLARSQSDDNPAYYIQYAHARICSVFRQAQERGIEYQHDAGSLQHLQQPQEKALLAHLGKFPETVSAAAEQAAPHSIAFYLRDLADLLHSYYNAHKFIVDDAQLQSARLSLISATRQVLRNGLGLLGVSAPERM